MNLRSSGLIIAIALVTANRGQSEPKLITPERESEMPTEFIMARHTFIDIGPPFDFYEVILVKSNQSRTNVERILVTPPGDPCTRPATVEVARASIAESISDLLEQRNPCAIPEKALKRELKRCKHCLVFSGANVTMSVQCGANRRLLRSDILDRDLFDKRPNTPEYTSRTMALLSRLDQALGPGVLEKPIFTLEAPADPATSSVNESSALALGRGDFDQLFIGGPHKLSDLYKAARVQPPSPTVELVSIGPARPQIGSTPKYPPLARAARVSGKVAFALDVMATGRAGNVRITDGHPLLRNAVREEVEKWTFPAGSAGQSIAGEMRFETNCTARQ